jgi:DNA-binding winged helix-turn-helix (wHTH) protein
VTYNIPVNSDVKHFESLYPVETREQELAQLVQYVQEGNSIQIVSLPGVGRSNILGLLAHNRQVREKHFPTKNAFVHFVLVNFSEVADRPLIDTTKLMFLNLVDSLRERDMLEEHAVASEIFRESLSYQDELVLFRGMKRVVEYLGVEKKLTLIFLFDRFEEYVPMLDHAFFSNLRILRDIAKYRFSVVFTLYKPLEDILEATILADFYEFVAGHTVYLRLYDGPSVLFRLEYLEKLTGKNIPDGIRSELIRLTGGHWKLTRAGAEAILANDVILSDARHHETVSPVRKESHRKEPSVNPQDDKLQAFLLEQKPIRGSLREMVFTLTPEEQQVLIGGQNVWEDHPEVKAYFEHIGLIHDGSVTIPLLTRYLEAEQAAKQTQKQPIVFDTEKNLIRKGETVLSDSLTSAEFRLLAYLLNHPDRVIDREELITIVWQEHKTTAGVTDQAVDQLIFRLRRKIEENPNQPTHLVTVKGRGFSFNP